MWRRGMSSVIAAVLLILLAIVSIAIVWGFIRIFIVGSQVDVNTLSSSLEVVPESVKLSGNIVEFNIRRIPGPGNVVGVIVAIEDASGQSQSREESFERTLNELETYRIIMAKESTLGNPVKITLAPIFLTESSKEEVGKVIKEFSIVDASAISCRLIRAQWDQRSASADSNAGWKVETENCEGLRVEIEIMEGSTSIGNDFASVSGEVASSSWRVESSGGSREYYFVARVASSPITASIQSRNLLSVSGPSTDHNPTTVCTPNLPDPVKCLVGGIEGERICNSLGTAYGGCILQVSDDDYLLPVTVTIADNPLTSFVDPKESFEITYNGKKLRSFTQYSRPTTHPGPGAYRYEFYSDESWGSNRLDIKYDIIPQKGGVDIKYTVKNPTSVRLTHPDFFITNINQDTGGTVKVLSTYNERSMLTVRNNPYSGSARFGVARWPRDVGYSPVNVLLDNSVAAGTTLLYPYLDYKVSVDPAIWTRNYAYGWSGTLPENTYTHSFHHFENTTSSEFLVSQKAGMSAPKSSIMPGETRTYTMTLRYSTPRNWIYTVSPYKKYFASLYNPPIASARDRRPIVISIPANVAYANWTKYQESLPTGAKPNAGYVTQYNDRGYQEDSQKKTRFDKLGLEPYTSTWINRTGGRGYRRLMIWTLAGIYSNSSTSTSTDWKENSNNYPVHITTELLPIVENSLGELTRFGQKGIDLGLYWGYGGRYPSPNGWNPKSVVQAYYGPSNMSFIRNEFNKALSLGTTEFGLDAYELETGYETYYWLKEMRSIAKNNYNRDIKMLIERGRSDIYHSQSGNWIENLDDDRDCDTVCKWARVNTVPLLSLYINPGSDMDMRMPDDANMVREALKRGYTPMTAGSVNLTANGIVDPSGNVLVPLLQCIDGIDNDGDGLTDLHDCDCADENGNSEGNGLNTACITRN